MILPIIKLTRARLFPELYDTRSKPCKRAKIEKGRQWKEDKRVKEEKREWVSFSFLNRHLSDEKKKNARLGHDFNSSAPFSEIQTFIFSLKLFCQLYLIPSPYLEYNYCVAITTLAKYGRATNKGSRKFAEDRIGWRRIVEIICSTKWSGEELTRMLYQVCPKGSLL